ncbi:MAG: hypothetical protein J0M08_11180 [Bacteroidetes bacterium]|nr:hypothetical protein [Bacteroidota bacterium]
MLFNAKIQLPIFHIHVGTRGVIYHAFFVIFLIPKIYFSQKFAGQFPSDKKYKLIEVYDSTYGINIYDKLIMGFNSDTIRNDKRGYAGQGWIEDYYESGKTLHRGYYVDGQLKIFKNYFDNGQMERNFRVVDFKKSSMEVYYQDGKLRSKSEFVEGVAQKEEDYYPNGQLEYYEELAKDLDQVIQRKSFFMDGKPESTFELLDKKKKRYAKKEYHENGVLKEEGEMVYNENSLDYVKDGKWKTFDENGKITSEEEYVAGELNRKIK